MQTEIQASAGVSIIDLLITVTKRKRLVIGLPIFLALAAAAISLAIPDTFKANTKILPPQQAQSGAVALLSQLGGVAGAAAGAAGIKNPNDLYIGMLRSRTVSDRLISRFNLRAVYDLQYDDSVRKKLEENSAIASGKDGLITIEVEDTDRKRAAALANAYAEELLRLTKSIAVTEASQRRLFFEQQLGTAKANLASAELALRTAMVTTGVISVDAQSRAVVETSSRLRAQLAAKEIQVSSMGAFVTTSNPEYLRAAQELRSMRAELARQENGAPAGASAAGATVSADGLENIKLLRDVKYFQMLYELLSKQYEVARLDESKDASIIQVLDKAVEPERKYRPLRALIVAVAGIIGLFVSIGLAFVLENLAKIRAQPSFAPKLGELRRTIGLRE